jgi:hypothetical protein
VVEVTPANEAEVRARIAVLENRVSDMQADIKDIYDLIQGGPNSMRTRLHKLEADRAAADAATAAVEAVKLVYAQASANKFTRAEKLIGLFIAFMLCASSITSLIFVLIHSN